MEAVQAQLLYLRHVLDIKAKEAILYQKTSKGKTFSLDQKVAHLKTLIAENEYAIAGNRQASTSQGSKLIARDERQSRIENQKLKVSKKSSTAECNKK